MPAPLDYRPPHRDHQQRVTGAERVFAIVTAVIVVGVLITVIAILIRLWL